MFFENYNLTKVCSFKLLVEAKDGGSPPLSSTATVAVSVRSVLSTVEPFLSAPTNQIVTRTETISNLPVQFGVKSFRHI